MSVMVHVDFIFLSRFFFILKSEDFLYNLQDLWSHRLEVDDHSKLSVLVEGSIEDGNLLRGLPNLQLSLQLVVVELDVGVVLLA